MRYLLESGIFRIHVSPINLAGRASERKELLCDTGEVLRIVSEFWYETFGLQLKSDRRETLNCGVGKYITVYPDGSVYPCHLLSFPEFCVGNVRNRGLYTIFHESEMLNRFRALDFREISQCYNCFRQLSGDDRCLGKVCRDKDSKDTLLELLEE